MSVHGGLPNPTRQALAACMKSEPEAMASSNEPELGTEGNEDANTSPAT